MRWIVLLAACVVPGSALLGCSSDGVTPACSEAPLYGNRYGEAERAEYEKLKGTPEQLPSLADNRGDDAERDEKLGTLATEKCITPLTVGSSTGGSSNGGSGNGGSGGTTGGTGGTTGGTGGTN